HELASATTLFPHFATTLKGPYCSNYATYPYDNQKNDTSLDSQIWFLLASHHHKLSLSPKFVFSSSTV
ncbi:MAG: hypothetical protein RSB09_02240, partial [Clostridia bacterium]